MRIIRQGISWILLIDIMISFIGFMSGMEIYKKIKESTENSNIYTYEYAYEYYIGSEVALGQTEVLSVFDDISGNVVISDCLLYVDSTSYYQNCNILYKQSEELKYPIIHGNMDVVRDELVVAVGKGMLPYCETIGNQKYINIEGETYKVIAVIGTDNSTLMEGSIILFYDSLGDGLRNKIQNEHEYTILQQSNIQDLSIESYQAVNKIYEYIPDGTVLLSENPGVFLDFSSDIVDGSFYIIICVFAMVNCVVISELWMLRRKNEIKIRKIWGYSNSKLFGLLFKDILSISFIAVVFGIILQLFAGLISSDMTQINGYRLLCTAVFLIMSSLIIVLLPVHKAYREIPIQNMEG